MESRVGLTPSPYIGGVLPTEVQAAPYTEVQLDNTAGDEEINIDPEDLNVATSGLPGLPGVSDRRLKENIELVGTSDSGINIYEFNFINSEDRYRGVMAQELLETMPDAVIVENGYYKVFYDKIDVNFDKIS